ncbi:hypothetical protein DBZ36_11100 [Alginatibacterium sediminis]|uniref:DUF2079 domain-containing protein n=2 Tax=Alginatibacterium sediminis TaxID=2164068 RepID=A0A420EAV3_9ALTE|nr:hypothetical protein DBZ36_11100 [Alginatibacterium sediminis]
MHSITLALALFCLNKMLQFKLSSFVLCSLLSFVTFQQASMPPLIFSIIIFMLFMKFEPRKSKYAAAYFVCAIGYFTLTSYLFPAHGLYAGYNNISLTNLFKSHLYSSYLDYIVKVYPAVLLLLGIVFVKSKDQRKCVFAFMMLIVMNAIPFILVGKTTAESHLDIVGGWNQRQSITITVIVAIIFGYLWQVSDSFSKRVWNQVAYVSIICSLVFVTYRYYLSTEVKVKSIALKTEMVELFKAYKSKLEACGIELEVSLPPEYRALSTYELNYIAWKSFNQRHYTYASDNGPGGIFKEPIYRDKYIQSITKPDCLNKVTYTSETYRLAMHEILLNDQYSYSLSIR